MIPRNDMKNRIDPVCLMKVTQSGNPPSFTINHQTYYFCADECRRAFVADPQKYTTANANKPKGWWGRYLDRLNKITGGKPPCCH